MLVVASPAHGWRPLKNAWAIPAGNTAPGGPPEAKPPSAVAAASADQVLMPMIRVNIGSQVVVAVRLTPTAVLGMDPPPTKPAETPARVT
jgi:hypothetical protein